MKISNTLLYILTIAYLIIHSCTAQSVDTFVSPEQQREDFKILRNILEEACPILSVHRTEEEIDAHFKKVEESFKKPERTSGFYLKIGNALSFFHDGHLRAYIGNDFYDAAANEKSHIPILITFLNEKIYIKNNYSDSELLKPKREILSINGVSAKQIITDFKNFHSADGNNNHFKYHRMNTEFRSYLTYYFKFPTEYKIRIKPNQISEEQVTVQAMSASEIKKSRQTSNQREDKDLFSITYDDKRKTAVFRFVTFGDQDGEKKLRKILERLVRNCKKRGIKNLILDIRDNGGGFDDNAAVVYSYFASTPFKALNGRFLKTKQLSFDEYLLNKDIEETLTSVPTLKFGEEFKLDMALDHSVQPSETVFTGAVYLLINRATFSTAALFANIFHNNERGLIIGQDCGGGYHGDSGGIAYIELPHSKMTIQIPLVRNEYIVEDKHANWTTIKPDISVPLSIKDINSETDEVMNAVLEKIDFKP
ncbi:S41 family peptidase [Psychroserpens luteolus]|uniref:S41 family peptidase n=1 Tax=Psychroserpens luteolus TaxID=2855840 RepID=UPI001E34B819|nr:S41 family peptidase [Psychroserpens luteolus]MCD2259447.1 hypothetical protein [Psychroserpens luteolus]